MRTQAPKRTRDACDGTANGIAVHGGKREFDDARLETLQQANTELEQRAAAAEAALAALAAAVATCPVCGAKAPPSALPPAADPRAERATKRALASWVGERRRFHGALWADEVRFDEAPPYGVVAPPAAKERLGTSLRCARKFLGGDELDRLQSELAWMPRSLSWGKASDRKMGLSKRKFFDLDAAAVEGVASGGDGVDRKGLDADLTCCPPRTACTAALATKVAAHVGFTPSPLRGMQANYQHTHYPQASLLQKSPRAWCAPHCPHCPHSLIARSTATTPRATALDATWRPSTCEATASSSSASTPPTRSRTRGGLRFPPATCGRCRGTVSTATCAGRAHTACPS